MVPFQLMNTVSGVPGVVDLMNERPGNTFCKRLEIKSPIVTDFRDLFITLVDIMSK